MKNPIKKIRNLLVVLFTLAVIGCSALVIPSCSSENEQFYDKEKPIYEKYIDVGLGELTNSFDNHMLYIEATQRFSSQLLFIKNQYKLKEGITSQILNISEELFSQFLIDLGNSNRKIETGNLIVIDGAVQWGYDESLMTSISPRLKSGVFEDFPPMNPGSTHIYSTPFSVHVARDMSQDSAQNYASGMNKVCSGIDAIYVIVGLGGLSTFTSPGPISGVVTSWAVLNAQAHSYMNSETAAAIGNAAKNGHVRVVTDQFIRGGSNMPPVSHTTVYDKDNKKVAEFPW